MISRDLSTAILCALALACIPSCGKKESPPAGGPAAGEEAAAEETPIADETYEIRLPSDKGLVNASDGTPGLATTVKFIRKDDVVAVRLRIRETKLVLQGEGDRRSCFAWDDLALKEDVIEEIRPEGAEKRVEKKGKIYFLDEETGRGKAGLEGAMEGLVREMRRYGLQALVDIEADLEVPVGLVMEAYRRASAIENVVGVNFQGHMDPLEGLDTPVFRPDRAPVVRGNESLKKDPSDGCPALCVAFVSGTLHVEFPFPPESGSGETGSALERLPGLTKAFAARNRDSDDPRLSRGWLYIRLPAEAPSALVWWLLQEAVKPGVGIWKIRVLLPGSHAYYEKK